MRPNKNEFTINFTCSECGGKKVGYTYSYTYQIDRGCLSTDNNNCHILYNNADNNPRKSYFHCMGCGLGLGEDSRDVVQKLQEGRMLIMAGYEEEEEE